VISRTLAFVTTTTTNNGSVRSHFTSECTVRQTNYLQQWLSSLPLYLRTQSTPDKLPTTTAKFAPTLPQTAQYAKLPTTLIQFAATLPQTAQYARQTTHNTGSVRCNFTSDCTVRQSLKCSLLLQSRTLPTSPPTRRKHFASSFLHFVINTRG
jgi:hypothetical protein